MAYPDSDYPGGIDSFPDPDTTLDGTPLHSELHLSHNDAIEKVQTELGINPAGSFATVTARFDHLIRRRASRTSQNFPNAATTTTMGAAITNHENVGGINHVGGVWTVPVAGFYLIRFSLAGGDTIPAGLTNCQLLINVASDRVVRMGGTGNSNQTAVYAGWVTTGDGIQFQVSNNSGGSFSSIPSVDIMKVPGP